MLSFNQKILASAIRFLAAVSLLVPNILNVEGGFATVALGVAFYIFYPVHIGLLYVLSAIIRS